MATGVIWSVSSAKREENRRRKGSRQVVPSGQIAKSPSAKSLRMLAASWSLLRVSATVLMGESTSDRREMEYVTAVIRRPKATERKIGSSKDLWEQTNSTPSFGPFLSCTEAGGFPLITTLTPSEVTRKYPQLIGSAPAAMRKTARIKPTGIQRRVMRARKGVGLCTRRPS